MDAELLKLLGPYGFGGIVAWMVWRVLSQIADRAIKAMDRVADTVADHTKIDLAHHTDVKLAVVRLEGKIDEALSWQASIPAVEIPAVPTRRQTHPRGVLASDHYGVRKLRDEDDD